MQEEKIQAPLDLVPPKRYMTYLCGGCSGDYESQDLYYADERAESIFPWLCVECHPLPQEYETLQDHIQRIL